MRYQLDSSSHSVYSLNYHLIFCVKYRRKVLTDSISNRLKDIIIGISQEFQVKIIEMETGQDHMAMICFSRELLYTYIIQDQANNQHDKVHKFDQRVEF